MKDKLKTLFLSNWTPAEKILLGADVLLLGILAGWLTSPFGKGLNLFSNNTWGFRGTVDSECEEWDPEEEEE